MKKRILFLAITVITLGCFLCIGCGNNEAAKDNTEKKLTNLTKEVNKLSVYLGEKEYFSSDDEKLSLIKELLNSVEYVENYTPEKEGGYVVNLYNNDDLIYEVVILGDEVIIEDNGFYKKEISSEKFEEIKDMLIELSNK